MHDYENYNNSNNNRLLYYSFVPQQLRCVIIVAFIYNNITRGLGFVFFTIKSDFLSRRCARGSHGACMGV